MTKEEAKKLTPAEWLDHVMKMARANAEAQKRAANREPREESASYRSAMIDAGRGRLLR